MGLTSPSVSRLIDVLVSRGFVTRDEHPEDRRRVKLAVTDHGRQALETCRKGTLAHLSERLRLLAPEEREAVVKALGALRSVFADKARGVV
jgi:DNA-binding MarR family transcriptional regulator